jgi:hypothetical protein
VYSRDKKDDQATYEQSAEICAVMQKVEATCELITIEGGGHGMRRWRAGDTAVEACHADMADQDVEREVRNERSCKPIQAKTHLRNLPPCCVIGFFSIAVTQLVLLGEHLRLAFGAQISAMDFNRFGSAGPMRGGDLL